MHRYLPALALTFAIVLAAPFVGRVRDFLFDSYGDQTVKVLAASLTGLAAVLFLGAIVRIRENRLLRYAGLAAVALLLYLQAVGFETELAQVNVAEKIHIVEYGLLALLLYRARRGRLESGAAEDFSLLVLPLLWVTLAGTCDEAMQWLVETRTGEIRDVALNVLSGLVGLLFALSLFPPERFSWRLPIDSALGDSAALTALVLATFFFFAHLGYLVEDPEIGRFRSMYSREELLQASKDRTQRWATDPPGDISPLTVEDQFLSEAGWHNHHRNSSFEHGFYGLARHANLILEKYYQPYLDLESFRNTGSRRFAPHAVQVLETEAPVLDVEGYVSPVLEGRIYTRPSKPAFLAIVIPSVLLLWWLPRWWGRRTFPGS